MVDTAQLTAGAINNPLHTFVLMAAVNLLNIAYIAGWLDTVAPEEEAAVAGNEKKAKRALLSLGHLKDSFDTCFLNRAPRERCRIAVLLAMAFIVLIISSGG